MLVALFLWASLLLLLVALWFMPQDDEISPNRKTGDFKSVTIDGPSGADGRRELPSNTLLTLKVYTSDGTLYTGKDLTVFLVREDSHRHTMLIHAQAHHPFEFMISPADLVKGNYYYIHVSNNYTEGREEKGSSINTALLRAT